MSALESYSPRRRSGKPFGFTLSELLIALAVLGVIATFTIPKVLQAQQDSSYKTIAKEAASMISGAYQIHKGQGLLNSKTRPKDLTPYMNYVAYDTSSLIDNVQTKTTSNCSLASAREGCLKLHNGAMLYLGKECFGDSQSYNVISFLVDPDGKVTGDGSGDTPGKALMLILYFDGRIKTENSVPSNLYDAYCDGANYGSESRWQVPAEVPPWFSWN